MLKSCILWWLKRLKSWCIHPMWRLNGVLTVLWASAFSLMLTDLPLVETWFSSLQNPNFLEKCSKQMQVKRLCLGPHAPFCRKWLVELESSFSTPWVVIGKEHPVLRGRHSVSILSSISIFSVVKQLSRLRKTQVWLPYIRFKGSTPTCKPLVHYSLKYFSFSRP